MKSMSRGVRMVLAGVVLAALVACATSVTKVACDGKLTPINPPAAKAGNQGAAYHVSPGVSP